MGLSWGRKSAALPVSSPARQDRCKVGGEREKERKHMKEQRQVKSVCDNAGVCTEGGEIMRKDGSRELKERKTKKRLYGIFNMIRRGKDAHWGTLKGLRLMAKGRKRL